MRDHCVEKVPEGEERRVGARWKQQANEGIDRLVVEGLAVDLGGDQAREPVVGGMSTGTSAPLGEHRREVVGEGIACGDGARRIEAVTEEPRGPSRESCPVRGRQPEQPHDHREGKRARELRDEIRLATLREALDEPRCERLEEVGRELRDARRREPGRHELAVTAVLRGGHALHRATLRGHREALVRLLSGKRCIVLERGGEIAVSQDQRRRAAVVADMRHAIPLAEPREDVVQGGTRIRSEVDVGQSHPTVVGRTAQSSSTCVSGIGRPPWHSRRAPVIQLA